ncbi:MAG: protein kinase, partial [Planctomycetota bacterium]
VALKVLSTGASRDEVVPKRFQQEIEVISRCEHPNIVRIFSSGEREGDAYFAMEYVEGVDLSDLDPNQTRLEGLPAAVSAAFEKRRSENPQLSEKLPEPNGKQNGKQGPGSGADSYRELVRYFRDAARALQNLHEQGILHRDIKPANLMVTLEDQRAVLMDLGLAKIVDADLTLTREEDGILGTPRYMPPEQLRNRKDFPVDARSDVYSLGATLYEMITGHAFHDAETREDLGEKVLHEEPVPVRKHRPDAPERLCWIVQKATEKDPGDRYQSAADMARDLDSFLEDRLLIARKQSWPHVLKLWVRRHRELTRSLAASALVLIAITIWFVVRLGEAEARIAELRDDSRILIEVEPETPRDVVTAILKLGEEEPEFVVPLTQVEPDAAALGADKPRISFELPEGFDEKQLRTYAYRKVRTYCGDDPSKLEKMRAVSRELMQIFEEDYSLQGVPWNTFVSLVHRIGKDSRGAIARGPWFAAVTAEQYLGLEEFSLEGVEVLERDLELAPEEEASRKPAQGPEKLGQKTEAREQAAPAAGKAPDKLALVVAIQNYPDVIRKTFGALKGPLNDARLIRDTLAGHFGFREQDIKLLTDAEATHEAIVRAFYEWLILRAGKDTEAVFWYCGHGSRVRDESGIPGAEQDGMDTSFLTFDSRSEGRDGEYDLVDDELHSLLCALTKRTRHVTLVTDACYSGGGFRGASLSGVRGGPRGKHAFEPAGVESFWPAGVPLLEDGDPRREGLEGYVHISACSNKQRAWEIQDDVDVKGEGKVKAFGALTYYLTQAMRDVEVGTSYRRVADQVKLLVSRKIPGQTVWAEGELDRELFGSRFEARLPGFPAQIQRSFLSVHAGALHGLSKGSLLRVRGPGNEVLGTAIVTHLNSRFANADWKERNKPVDASTPLHVEEISRPAQLPPLTVYTESSRVAALFEGSPRVRVTNTKPKLRDYHLLAEDGAWALRTNEGIRIWAGKVFEKLDRRKLEDRFQKELQHRALWGLAQEPGSLRLAARFVPPEEEDFADLDDSKDAAVVPCQKQEGREYEVTLPPLNEDDLRLAVLEVTNKDRREVFITVLSINESREINVVWPRLGQRDRILPAGESCRVPIAVYSEPEWSLDRPMCDRYLVIATRRFVSFEPFVSDEALRAGREPLPGILQIAFDGNRTRSGRRIKVGLRNFGTTWVDLQIHKKQ